MTEYQKQLADFMAEHDLEPHIQRLMQGAFECGWNAALIQAFDRVMKFDPVDVPMLRFRQQHDRRQVITNLHSWVTQETEAEK